MSSWRNLFDLIRYTMGLALLISTTAFGQLNSWTNTAGGNWEDASWSLGVLPLEAQNVVITNANSKTVTVGPITAQNFPTAMTNNALTLSGPSGTTNTLSLDSFGTNILLQCGGTSTVASNAVLTLNNAGIIFRKDVLLSGQVIQNGGLFAAPSVVYPSTLDGNYCLTNGRVFVQLLNFGLNANATLHQSGGEFATGSLLMGFQNGSGAYTMHDGNAIAQAIYLGYNGTASFTQMVGTVVAQQSIQIGRTTISSGTYVLQSGSLTVPDLAVDDKGAATFIQNGGSNIVTSSLHLSPNDSGASALYQLNDGVLQTAASSVGGGFSANNQFVQSGGLHITTGLSVSGNTFNNSKYSLVNGLLRGNSASFGGGPSGLPFVQSGGDASFSGSVGILGEGKSTGQTTRFRITGGNFSCMDLASTSANVEILGSATVVVTNGVTISGTIAGFLEPPYLGASTFSITGGSLSASNIDVNARFAITGPEPRISNAGYFKIGRFLTVTDANENLGRLRITSSFGGPAALYFVGTQNKLTFADSSGETWSATLNINGWNGSLMGGGAHQLFIGTNVNGVTASQLSQIKFINAPGLAGTNNARILATGEIVPLYRSMLYSSADAGGLVLTWSNAVSLQTSTNVEGPYVDVSATSPFTNNFTEAQRFFRLRQ